MLSHFHVIEEETLECLKEEEVEGLLAEREVVSQPSDVSPPLT